MPILPGQTLHHIGDKMVLYIRPTISVTIHGDYRDLMDAWLAYDETARSLIGRFVLIGSLTDGQSRHLPAQLRDRLEVMRVKDFVRSGWQISANGGPWRDA